MLKEQVAEILYADGDGLPVNGWHYLNHISKDIYRAKAEQILNLFKSVVEELTVIDESACVKEFDRASFRQDEKGEYNRLRQAKQAIANLQLQADKDRLLDLMGE